MTSKNKKAVGALSAGMVAGAGLGMMGSYMFSHKGRVKKTARKAAKFISGILSDMENMM